MILLIAFIICAGVNERTLTCDVVALSEVRPLKMVDLVFSTPETLVTNRADIELEK